MCGAMCPLEKYGPVESVIVQGNIAERVAELARTHRSALVDDQPLRKPCATGRGRLWPCFAELAMARPPSSRESFGATAKEFCAAATSGSPIDPTMPLRWRFSEETKVWLLLTPL